MTDTLLCRHTNQIEEALARSVAGHSLLRSILRYHIGLTEADGRPATEGGKLLRPRLLLFVAEDLGGSVEEAVSAAVALELIHAFSLLHDDIQDGDRTRRGRPAAWTLWGVPQAINAGDLLHALAIRTALRAGQDVTNLLLAATEEMIEGQSEDLRFEGRNVPLRSYLEMVDKKTGALITAALDMGGVLAQATDDVRGHLHTLGRSIGRAFQIQDDLLGVWGNADRVGKPSGSDIRRRKTAYPMLLAFERATGAGRELLEATYAQQLPLTEAQVDQVVRLINALGVRESAEAAVHEALNDATTALEAVPLSHAGREEMHRLLGYLGRRDR